MSTFYTCRACGHPDNLHKAADSRPCDVDPPNECDCTAYQAPVLFGEVGQRGRQILSLIEDLARLGSQLEEPTELVDLVGLFCTRLIVRRYEAAGKGGFSQDEGRRRLAQTELLQAVLADLWAGHEGDGRATQGEYIRTYTDTVLSKPWWGVPD